MSKCLNSAQNLEEAKQRYMAGFCPDCGRKTEHRPKLADHFCHHCHKNWIFKIVEEKFGVKPAVATVVAGQVIPGAGVVRRGEEAKKSFLSVSSLLFWKKFQKK